MGDNSDRALYLHTFEAIREDNQFLSLVLEGMIPVIVEVDHQACRRL